MAVEEFLTGALQQGTRELVDLADRNRAKKERERKLRVMQQAATALQEYQRTGKAIDPKLAAEAASVGFQLPLESTRGFDPSVLKGAVPEVQLGPISDLGAEPAGGAVSDPQQPVQAGEQVGAGPDSPAARFESGALSFQEAEAQGVAGRQAAELGLRRAKANEEAATFIATHGSTAPKDHTPEVAKEFYLALVQQGQLQGQQGKMELANRYATDRWKTNPANTRPKTEEEKTRDSQAFKDAMKTIGGGETELKNLPVEQRDAFVSVFKSKTAREAILQPAKDGTDTWEIGNSGIDSKERRLFVFPGTGLYSEHLKNEALASLMRGDEGEMTAEQARLLMEVYDLKTGERKTAAVVKEGQRIEAIGKEVAKREALPDVVQQLLKDFIPQRLNEIRRTPKGQDVRKVDWRLVETKLRAAGSEISIARFQALVEEEIARISQSQQDR